MEPSTTKVSEPKRWDTGSPSTAQSFAYCPVILLPEPAVAVAVSMMVQFKHAWPEQPPAVQTAAGTAPAARCSDRQLPTDLQPGSPLQMGTLPALVPCAHTAPT